MFYKNNKYCIYNKNQKISNIFIGSKTIEKEININEVPYISTYYIKPIVKTNEEVFINYYITDYWHKEYLERDFNESFNITVKVKNQIDRTYTNLKAGDNKISLGTFANEGEIDFSLICVDKYGRSSHELFNYFLVRNEPVINEYIMTEQDLITYNIKNNDNYEEILHVDVNYIPYDPDNPSSADTANNQEMINTINSIQTAYNNKIVASKKYCCIIPRINDGKAYRWFKTAKVKYADDYDKNAVMNEATTTKNGLQNLINDKKNEGYNKIKLLTGIYRIDGIIDTTVTPNIKNSHISIPTNMTLDLNNSKIKLNQNNISKCYIIRIDNCFDSHVINGTIEGDYFSHDYANSPNNSEWVHGVHIGGSSKYCSYENVIVKNNTGYGITNGVNNPLGMSYYNLALGNTFTFKDVNLITGEDIPSTNRTTSNFIDISNYIQYKYIYVNKYSGYQNVFGGTWNIICHFYDSNKTYIKSIFGWQFRRVLIPENSHYMKVTIMNGETTDQLSITHFRIPNHCWVINSVIENCRCVGITPYAMNDMYMENCEVKFNGQSGAFCALDIEDGWEQSQDATYKNLNFHDNYRNDFLTCAGQNIIVDSMANGSLHFYGRTNSYVVKNSKHIVNATIGHGQNGKNVFSRNYIRFYNNTIENGKLTVVADAEVNIKTPVCIKDCNINAYININNTYDILKRCKVDNFNNEYRIMKAIIGGTFIDSLIQNRDSSHHNSANFYNCTLTNITSQLQGIWNLHYCTLNNITLKCLTSDTQIIPTFNTYNCIKENVNIS